MEEFAYADTRAAALELIGRLDELHRQGALTKREFLDKKSELLGRV